MSKLPISKEEEAEAVAIIWNMGCHSLDPDRYIDLEEILKSICENRNIDNESVAWFQTVMSGKRRHASDCETSNSPIFLPGPCDCSCSC